MRAQTNSDCAALSYAGTLIARLRYDPMGRLYEVHDPVAGTTRRQLYDGDALVAEYGPNSGDPPLRRFVHGSDASADDPLLWYEGSGLGDGPRRHLLADHRGSIAGVLDGQGAPFAYNSYDEYGIPGAGNAGRFQYTGQAWVPELGMYYYKARLYSPTLGRFLQVDPIGYEDQFNLYAYVGNDPVNKVDPTGMNNCLVETPNGESVNVPNCIGHPDVPPATPEEQAAATSAIIVTAKPFTNSSAAPRASAAALATMSSYTGGYKGVNGQLYYVPYSNTCSINGLNVGEFDGRDFEDADFGGHPHTSNTASGVGPDDAMMAAMVRSGVAVQNDTTGIRVIQRTRGGFYRVISNNGNWGQQGRRGTQKLVDSWNAAAGEKRAGDTASASVSKGCPK